MTFLGVVVNILIGHGFWLNGIVFMPPIGLPTTDLGEIHSLQKPCKPVAEVSFCPTFHVRFVHFVRFVRFVRFARFVRFVSFVSLNVISPIS